MSIQSVDDLASGYGSSPGPVRWRKIGTTAEAANILHSTWFNTGVPNSGAAAAGGLNGANFTSDPTMVTGQVPFVKAAAGRNKHLAMLTGRASGSGSLMLCDRLWGNGTIVATTTTAQTITFPTPVSRDVNGAALGAGVLAAIEVSSATGNGSPVSTITLSYTNESGTAGRTATMPSFPATAVAGTFVEFLLQAGDYGIRSIQNITLGTTLVSGAIHIVTYRPLALLQFRSSDLKDRITWDEMGMPQLYDGTVPFFVWDPEATTAVDVAGLIAYAEK